MPSKDSDQPANPCSLIRSVFAVHMKEPRVLYSSLSAQRKLIEFGRHNAYLLYTRKVSSENHCMDSFGSVYLIRGWSTFLFHKLTLKMPRKPASENVVCLCRLLNILANFSNLFLHTGKSGSTLFAKMTFKITSR